MSGTKKQRQAYNKKLEIKNPDKPTEDKEWESVIPKKKNVQTKT